MIVSSIKDLPVGHDQFALLDLQDHGSVEVVDGRWVDRHGYRERMRALCEREKTVEFDAVAANRRATK